MANLNRLAQAAAKALEKSKLGGIKKERAVKAIKEVAKEGQIEQLTQTASSQSAGITGLSQEAQEAIQQLKNSLCSRRNSHKR